MTDKGEQAWILKTRMEQFHFMMHAQEVLMKVFKHCWMLLGINTIPPTLIVKRFFFVQHIMIENKGRAF
jgi:hypothetical protein